jgi:hypothetical protein
MIIEPICFVYVVGFGVFCYCGNLINQILKNNSLTTCYKNLAPTTPDVLAIVPIKPSSNDKLYVDFSGPLQDNKRVYFGPVDIERLKIRLLNDKGQLLNLLIAIPNNTKSIPFRLNF